MDVPIQADFDPPSPIPHVSIGNMSIALKDYNFWMGSAGVNVVFSPKVTAFVSATGFLPKEFVQTGALPISVGQQNFLPLLSFTGSHLEYWTFPSALTYNLNQPGSLLSLTLEYSVLPKPPATFSLWFNATTQSIKGPSDVTFEAPGVFIARTADKLVLSQ
ncbi:MAG: hypothetical protein AB7V04_00745, partial [Desulfomonilaceae bacterium]